MKVWSTAATVVLLLVCCWSPVSCQDLQPLDDGTQTNPILPPSRRSRQGGYSPHLNSLGPGHTSQPINDAEEPRRPQGGVSPTNNNGNEATRSWQGDNPRRVVWPDGSSPMSTRDDGLGDDKNPHPDGQGPKNLSPGRSEDHGHSVEPHGPETKYSPGRGAEEHSDHGLGDSKNPHPDGQGPKNPSSGRSEDPSHSVEPHGPETKYSRGTGAEEHSDHGAEDEEGLCQSLCLCKHDDSVVSCEHQHVNDQDHIHDLFLDASRLPKKVKTFRAIGFDKVDIFPGTFADPNRVVEHIILKDIGSVILHSGSLYFHEYSKGNTKVEVVFDGCTIPAIPEKAITQNVTRHDSETIELGLEDTRYIDLVIDRCSVGDIARHAIVDTRFINLSINNTKIDHIETGSIDIDVYEQFEMVNTDVPTLTRNSVSIRSDGVVVFSQNAFNRIEGFAFNVTSDSQVLFEHNHVGELDASALLGIVPPRNARGASIVFLDNQVEIAAPEALVIHQRYQAHERKVLRNKFDVPCTCNISEIFGDLLNTNNFEGGVFKAVMDNSLCSNEGSVYMNIEEYLDEECWTFNLLYIIVASLVLAVILTLTVVIIICWQRVKKLKEENSYATEGSTRSFSTIRSCPPLSPGVPGPPSSEGRISPSWVMAIPEIKTYQETEVYMPHERTQTMESSKLSYTGSPYHSYKSNDGRTPSLLH